MQVNIEFIIATDADCSKLASLNKALIDDGGSINSMPIDELEFRMHEFLSQDYTAIIFTVDSIQVGYTLVDTNHTPMFIRHFFIAKEHRRQGFGTAAFHKLVNFLDAKQLDLSVLRSNEVGNRFWINCGFEPYETIMHYRK